MSPLFHVPTGLKFLLWQICFNIGCQSKSFLQNNFKRFKSKSMLPIENKGLKTLLLQKFTKQSNNLSANFNNLLFVTAVLSLRLVLSMLFYLFVTSNLNHNTWCQTNSN